LTRILSIYRLSREKKCSLSGEDVTVEVNFIIGLLIEPSAQTFQVAKELLFGM
jgi:hypothetical protein